MALVSGHDPCRPVENWTVRRDHVLPGALVTGLTGGRHCQVVDVESFNILGNGLRLRGLIVKPIGDAAADRHVQRLECEMSVEERQALQDLSMQPSNLRPIQFGYVCLHSHSLVRQ